MKRILALVLVLILSVGWTTAFAGDTPEADMVIRKVMEKNDASVTNPGETFIFEFTPLDPSEGPVIPNVEIAYATGELGPKAGFFNLDNFKSEDVPAGKYVYTVTEKAGNTAGMSYSQRIGELHVFKPYGSTPYAFLIVKEPGGTKKEENFLNKFSAGRLLIRKAITGGFAEPDRAFKITVELKAPEGKVVNTETITVSIDGAEVDIPVVFNEQGIAIVELELKGGQNGEIYNLPFGVTYKVQEEDLSGEGYEVKYYGTETGEMDSYAEFVNITNHKELPPPTGIMLDNMPFIVMLVLAAAGLIVFILRKRIINH